MKKVIAIATRIVGGVTVILGIAAVIAGIVAAVYYFITKKDNRKTQYSEASKSEFKDGKTSDLSANVEDEDKTYINLSSFKQETSSIINERHAEAAQMIRESIEHVYEVTSQSPEQEESEADEVNAQLDALLK